MLIQERNAQRQTQIQQVHVAVIESGADKPAQQIHLPVSRNRKNFCIRTDGRECSVFHHKCLLQRQCSGIDLSVIVSGFHDKTSRFIFLIVPNIIGLCKKNRCEVPHTGFGNMQEITDPFLP